MESLRCLVDYTSTYSLLDLVIAMSLSFLSLLFSSSNICTRETS